MVLRRRDTLLFETPPVIAACLTQQADFSAEGCKNWEQAESLLQRKAADACLRKAGISKKEIDLAFAGDLQAQCTASNYTMRGLGMPFAGVYGACSTMAETLGLAACFAATGMARQVLAHEPARALFVPDGHPLLFYEHIGAFAWRHLSAGGRLYFEIHYDAGAAVVELLRSLGFAEVELRRDLAGHDRMVKAVR